MLVSIIAMARCEERRNFTVDAEIRSRLTVQYSSFTILQALSAMADGVVALVLGDREEPADRYMMPWSFDSPDL